MAIQPATQFSFGRAWLDMMALFAAHRDMLVALAGVLVFLPALAWRLFVPLPEINPDGRDAFAVTAAFFSSWWPVLLAIALLTMVHTLGVCAIVLRKDQTAGEALRWALACAPSGFGVWLLTFAMATGTSLFCVSLATLVSMGLFGQSAAGLVLLLPAFLPAIYLVGRTLMALPATVAVPEPNPLAAMARSFAHSKGNGWRIALCFFQILLPLLLISMLVSGLVGLLAQGLLPSGLANIVTGVVNAAFSGVTGVLTSLLAASAWRLQTRL